MEGILTPKIVSIPVIVILKDDGFGWKFVVNCTLFIQFNNLKFVVENHSLGILWMYQLNEVRKNMFGPCERQRVISIVNASTIYPLMLMIKSK